MTGSGDLIVAIENKDATVGVIGLGYVGLPLSLSFAEAGFAVRGFDIDDYRVGELRAGNSYIDDVTDGELSEAIKNNFVPSTDPDVLANCDAYVIAVPTGMDGKKPDMSAVKAAAKTAATQAGRDETLIIVSSTVYPGATKELVQPIIESHCEGATKIAMVPERLNPGGGYAFEDIPLVVGADKKDAMVAARTLFASIVTQTYPVNSTVTAELTKTLENTYRMVNIALVNELITLAEGLDGNVWDAIDAAATKPFGFQPFRPGPGVGGHCIPVDPQFLTWRAEDLDTSVSFIDDAHQINKQMPKLVADRTETLLKVRGVPLEEASIVALGAAYKPNVGDTRNSPALQVVELLSDEVDVTVVDPHTASENIAQTLVETEEEAGIADVDLVILLVDHSAFDLTVIGEQAQLIFDTRNAMPSDVAADVITLGEIVNQPTKPTTKVPLSQD